MSQFQPYGGPATPEPVLAMRVGELEHENAELRRRVRRYHRGSVALGTLLTLLLLTRIWTAITLSA